MSWRFPLGFALLAALPVILWLHRQRRRVPERAVASLVPWLVLRVAEPLRRRRVPPSVLLALHLACAAALALAAAGPLRRGAAAPSGDVALVVDTTSSMRAGDRWPAARAAAVRAIASGAGRVTIVALGPRPAVVIARTLDRAAAAAAVEALAPGGVGADVAGALALARAVAGDGAAITVVTDGALAPPAGDAAAGARPPRAGGTRIRWAIVGRDAAPANVAVVGIAAADDGAGGVRLVARIGYFGPGQREARVALRIGGRTIDSSTIRLDADAITAVAWRVAARSGVAEVSAQLLDDRGAVVGDALGADDAALVPLAQRGRRAQLAGQSTALRRALAAQPRFTIAEVGLGTLADDGTVDVTVIHGAAPATLPLGGALVVAPRLGAWLEAAGDAITGTWRSAAPHPITAGLDLDGARVAGVRATGAPAWADVLAVVGGRPAVWAGSRSGQRIVVLALDPDGGTLAQREAFPVLVGRALEWASPDGPPPSLTAGSPLALPPWPVAITAPDGRRTLAALRFDDTLTTGLYTIRRQHVPRAGQAEIADVAAVRAGDERESALAARTADDLAATFATERSARGADAADAAGPAGLAGAADDGGSGAIGRPAQPSRPMQRWPLLVALALLAIEAAWRAAPARRPPVSAGRAS